MKSFHGFNNIPQAITDEEKAAIRAVMQPIIAECSEEHDVSEGDIETAKETANADAIKPCFLGCILKKTNVVSGLWTLLVD